MKRQLLHSVAMGGNVTEASHNTGRKTVPRTYSLQRFKYLSQITSKIRGCKVANP